MIPCRESCIQNTRIPFLIALVALWVGMLIFLGVSYQQTVSSIWTNARQAAKERTTIAAQEIDAFIHTLIPTAQQLADTVGTKSLDNSELETLLKKKPVEIFGLGVAFLPYARNKQTRLYAPYFVEQQGQQQMIPIQDIYDYTQKHHTWFHEPLTHGAQFNKPYFGQASDTVIIEYAVPIVNSQTNKPIGVAFASQSVEHINHVLASVYRDQTGYSFILDRDGTFLGHPVHSLVRKQENVHDTATRTNNTSLARAIKQIDERQTLEAFEYLNEINGARSWLFCEPIPTTQWLLCYSFDIDEIAIATHVNGQQLYDYQRQQLMIIVSILLVGLIVIIMAFSYHTTDVVRLWLITTVVSCLIFASLWALWYITHRYPDYEAHVRIIQHKKDLTALLQTKTTSSSESSFIANLTTLPALINNVPIIPTGIFINQLEFVDKDKIRLVAYIWQRYNPELHEHVSRGFVLPQAQRAKIKQVNHIKDGTHEVLLWLVEATMNQNLYFHTYPFDVKDLRIEIWHKDFDKTAILVPDFDAYRLINPRSLIGLDPLIDIDGWQLEGSYFGYRQADYPTNFGMYRMGPFGAYSSIEQSTDFEFCFNIMAKRKLIDTIVADLIPLAVIATILFVILLTHVQQGIGVLGSAAAVLFGAIIEQTRFHSKAASPQLVYFENFYLVIYTAIVAVVIISLCYLLEAPIRSIQYRAALVWQLLYWPVLLQSLFLITLYYLY